MKCPHCNYEHIDFDLASMGPIPGEEGDFYKLPLQVVKNNVYGKNVYGCPSCKMVFIE